MTIIEAESAELIGCVRELFLEYRRSIHLDLCFQNFSKELDELPGAYARPGGRLWLAQEEDVYGGCIALRPFEGSVCEMKRLFVQARFRGRGIGRHLAAALVAEASAAGYTTMRLDTLPVMREAIALYTSLGFREIAPYRHNPVEGALFFELTLPPSQSLR